MRNAMIRALGLVAAMTTSCGDEGNCDQVNVDGCYLEVECTQGQLCSVTTEEMNTLCACLSDLGCDQNWYHEYCDGAPYEPGECGSCVDEPDAG